MNSSPRNDDAFVTKTTKHRKKQPPVSLVTKKPPIGSSSSNEEAPITTSNSSTSSSSSNNISLRPRTMFAMKGRGRTDSEGSAYRPQWSKDGEGFVSSSSSSSLGNGLTSIKDAAVGTGDDPRGDRRKNKVLRYSKEELLALHVITKEVPTFPPETTVASEHSLPPVSTLPFDYDEIYKQWSLNRNRGRGRGRGNVPPGGVQGTRGHQRGEESEGAAKQQQRDEHHRHNDRWERGVKVTEGSRGDDVWDDVLEAGVDSNEMDLSSMSEAAEKFRREMDAMRDELQGPKIDPDEIKDDLDAFDKKLEDAAAAGQFDDSDNEDAPWDDPSSQVQHNDNGASVPLEDDTANLLGRQSGESHVFEALAPADEKLVLEEKSSFSLSHMPADEGLARLSSLRLEVEDEWFYLDPQGLQQGPFKTAEMREWFEAGYFKPHLPIRFGREGVFTALANQFVHGQIPFAAPATHVGEGMHVDPRQGEQQRLLELQHEQQRQQQQEMMQLQQQQQQRMLQLNQEEKVRLEMQRLEVARQQQQTQLFQQQQMLHHQQEQQRQQQQQQQQQQQILLQQQSSWQHSQREGIMSALGMFGRNQDNVAPNDNFVIDGMQTQFRSEYHTQHQMNMQNTQPLAQGTMFLKDEVQSHGQAFWPNTAPDMIGLENVTSSLGDLQAAQPTSSMAPEFSQPSAPKSPVSAAVPDAWGVRPNVPERPSTNLHDIQNNEKGCAVLEARKNDDQVMAQPEKPTNASPAKYSKKDTKPIEDNEKKNPSPLRKNGNQVEKSKSETHAWATQSASATASTKSKSLKDIQQEEQRELLNKMSDNKGNTANLAQMGAQLKMMLGVDSVAVTANTAPVSAPPAPVSKLTVKPTPAPTSHPHTSVASPWGTPATVTKSNTSKSMRDILAEEERLAQERARANENAPTSSHWMNIVAGNKVAAAAIPKPSRSVLGPVPASVLKSRQQIRATNGTPKPSSLQTERDASFWNFGAAPSAGKEFASNGAQVDSSNAFGSSKISSEFMGWAVKQLKTIDSNANVTLLEYCASVEDPGEIREYLAAYLGSTPRVSAFATEFIQRKRTQHSGKKSPGHQDAQLRTSESGSSTKRGRR
ncbi:hypothetical protein KXD40_005775 [Peronospora effusa]|nr:hypothetical protein KXD40_005775 [Peronospora effusa]CAI5700857.1 unnamed protein product [Peronospora effusa]